MAKHPLELLLIYFKPIVAGSTVDNLVSLIIKVFEGDAKDPFGRPIGPRVRIASSDIAQHLKAALERAERVAVLPLADADWVASDSESIAREIAACVDANAELTRFFPVNLHANWSQIFKQTSLGRAQGLIRPKPNLPLAIDEQERAVMALMQECVKWLRGSSADNVDAAFTVFLSHAKHDGKDLTSLLQKTLEIDWHVQGFFDARNIPPGEDFGKVLLEEAGGKSHAAMIVVQTDAYAGRPWCQRELAAAKKADIPILVLDALHHGEPRSFPYLGNVRTVRIDPDAQEFSKAVMVLMQECLRTEYFRLEARAFAPGLTAVARPPELFAAPPQTVHLVYPDPAIGNVERDLLPGESTAMSLRQARLHTLGVPENFKSLSAALSISDPASLAIRGLHASHVALAWMGINRLLFELQISVAYGGDPRVLGFTDQLMDIAGAHLREERFKPPVKNFLAAHLAATFTTEQRADKKHVIDVVDVPAPSDLTSASVDALYRARALTAMRRTMAERTDFRVLLGGKTGSVDGRYVGLAEEALMHLELGKPIYLLGYLGGSAHKLALWAADGRANPFDDDDPNPGMRDMRAMYATTAVDQDQVYDVDGHAQHFRALYNSHDNGLDSNERAILAKTNDLEEALCLLAVGLGRRFWSVNAAEV